MDNNFLNEFNGIIKAASTGFLYKKIIATA
jgi:hypothetical protein